MTFAVTMPALSDTMGAGRLVKWTKKVGDKISKGDVIAEVETDKAVMEVEAFQDGYLGGPLAAEGSEAPVGETIGYITDSPGEVTKTKSVAAPGPAGGDGQVSAAPAVKPSPVSAVLAASMSAGRPVVRPHMRPSSPPATGVESSQQYQPTPSGADTAIAAGPPYRLERASSAREAVARNMIASAAAPSFHVTARLPLQALMESAKTHGHALSVLLARACALTVKANPLFNAAYTSKGLAHRDRIDIGVALDSGEGLITPVLRDAAGRSLADLNDAWAKLREQATTRRLAPADYSGATFYISNLGVHSIVREFDSIVPIGACSILSIAASGPDGASFTLTCDHRVVFGADAARFLETLEQYMKDPGKLFTEGTKQ